jgi:hypothetical protein
MNIRKPGLSAALLLLITASCSAQTVSPIESSIRRVGQPSATAPAVEHSAAASNIETLPMPIAAIDQTTLDQVLHLIHDSNPQFNNVVIRAPGVPANYPTIPAMNFKNVTIGQFLQFVQVSFPGTTCFRIDGATGPLYSFRISPENMFGGGGRGGDDPFPKPNSVHLYRLTEVINNLADDNTAKDSKENKDTPRQDRIKSATDEVLSLLQAALDQTDPDGPCVLKMHDPTLTLLFKGSAAKQSVLEDAIASLGGGVRSPRGFISGRASGNGGFSPPADDANQQARILYQNALMQREAEIAALQDRLAQTTKSLTTKPSKD